MANNYLAVKDAFEKKRNAAQTKAEQNKARLRRESPEFESVESEIASLGISLIRCMQDMGSDHSADILRIKEKMKALRTLRAEILSSLGYDESYITPEYECDKCEDTGLIGIDICDCFTRALKRENYLSSGLGKALLRQKFENFDLTLYPAESRESMKELFEYCKEYVADFSDKSPSLLFMGGTGLGKTHLSSAIAMGVLDKGCDVVYDTAQSIFSAYEKNRFNREDNETAKYTECTLLIIDDLGAEMGGNMAESTLYNILNARMNAQLPTLISTNLSPNEIKAKYDDRIISRLFGQFMLLRFTGKDIRLQKLLGE